MFAAVTAAAINVSRAGKTFAWSRAAQEKSTQMAAADQDVTHQLHPSCGRLQDLGGAAVSEFVLAPQKASATGTCEVVASKK